MHSHVEQPGATYTAYLNNLPLLVGLDTSCRVVQSTLEQNSQQAKKIAASALSMRPLTQQGHGTFTDC